MPTWTGRGWVPVASAQCPSPWAGPVQLLPGETTGQNWGFSLPAFIPDGESGDIQLPLEDRNGITGHLRARFQQSEGRQGMGSISEPEEQSVPGPWDLSAQQ